MKKRTDRSTGPRAFDISSDAASTRIASVKLFDKLARRRVPPRRNQRLLHAALLRGFQVNVGSTAPSPQAVHRRKHFRLGAHEFLLLVREQVSPFPRPYPDTPASRKSFRAHENQDDSCAHPPSLPENAAPCAENPPPSSPLPHSRPTAPHHHHASLPEPARRCSSSAKSAQSDPPLQTGTHAHNPQNIRRWSGVNYRKAQ